MALATGLKLSIKRIKAKIAAVVETGLVMWHKMTANTWTGANRLPDSSTNSNTAALYTGRGLSFDGVNDVVTVGDTGQTVRTVVFYAYPDTTTTAFMQLQSSGAVRVEIASGTLSATGFTSPTLYVNGAAGSTVAATTWQQLAVTSATGVSASNVLLGQSNTTYYGGDLSNVKFFSVQLSAAQIAELYANPEQVLPTGVSAGELVRWWPMAEGGLILLDGSGNSDHEIIAGATEIVNLPLPVTQSSLIGNNKAMWFDGVDDSITGSNVSAPSNITIYVAGIFYGFTFDYPFKFGQVAVGLSPTQVRYTPNNTTNLYTINGFSLSEYVLYELFFTQNGTTLKCYQGDTLIDTSTIAPVNTTASGINIGNLFGAALTGTVLRAAVWDIDLLQDEISEIQTTGINFDLTNNTGNYVSSANLQVYYKNTGNQNYNWVDLSGNGNDGTVNGSPLISNMIEGVTSGIDLLGSTLVNVNTGELILTADGYALITDAATLDITTAITLEAWVKPFTVSTAQTIIGKNTAYALGLTSAGKPVFTKWTSAASTATATTTTALTVNTWYHIAVTYDGTNVKIYIDGAIDTTTAVSGAIDSTSTDVLMGALTTSTELFSGYIDSVKIYSSDLTAAQVAENYNAETAAHSNA